MCWHGKIFCMLWFGWKKHVLCGAVPSKLESAVYVSSGHSGHIDGLCSEEFYEFSESLAYG